jgi:hypothetical protein
MFRRNARVAPTWRAETASAMTAIIGLWRLRATNETLFVQPSRYHRRSALFDAPIN